MTPFERLVFKELFAPHDKDDDIAMQRYVKQTFVQMADTIQHEKQKLLQHHQQQPQSTYPLASRLAELHRHSSNNQEQQQRQRPVETDSNWWEQQPQQKLYQPRREQHYEPQQQQQHQRLVETYSNWWERDEFTEPTPSPSRSSSASISPPPHYSLQQQQPRYLAETASSRSRRIARERDTRHRLQQSEQPPLAHQAIFPAPLAFTSRMGL